MKRFRDQPIKMKLVVIIMAASIIAVISGLVTYLTFDMIRIRNDMKRNAQLSAAMVSQYSVVPLIFDYSDEANDVLAKLNTMPYVLDACVYDTLGAIFSSYRKTKDDGYVFPGMKDRKPEFSKGLLHVYNNIVYNDKNYGTLYLRISTTSIDQKFRTNLLVIFIVIAILGIPVYVIANRLQKFISRPILDLARHTQEISERQDYSVRLKYSGSDEIQTLYDQFGILLHRISERQAERDKAEEQLKTLNEQLKKELDERRQIESSLRISEERYRYLFDRNPAPMAIYDHSSLTVLAVNEAFLTLYGYNTEEIQVMHLADFYPENEKDPIVELVRGLKGYGKTGEWHHIKKNGTAFPVITTSHDLVYAGKNARIVVITDITERQKAEKEISLLAQVIKNVNEYVSITDMQNNISFVNQAWLKAFGYTEEEVIGKNIGIIISPNNPPEMENEILAATKKADGKGK